MSANLAGMETPALALNLPPKLALTREETAKALGLSAPTIDRLAARKLLRPSRATRRPLYSVQEIERFLRETTAVLGP
jgi:predicted PP-loop superfamily ATPase